MRPTGQRRSAPPAGVTDNKFKRGCWLNFMLTHAAQYFTVVLFPGLSRRGEKVAAYHPGRGTIGTGTRRCQMGMISSFYRVAQTYGRKSKTKADKKARKRRKMPYAEFLQSEYWQSVRQAVLERENNRCHLCHYSGSLQVHHITYAHRGDELRNLETVTALCAQCHAKVHGKKSAA